MGSLKDTFKKPEMSLQIQEEQPQTQAVATMERPTPEQEPVTQKPVQVKAADSVIKYDNLNSRVERQTKEWLDKFVRDIKDAQGKKVVKQEDLVQISLAIFKHQNINPEQITSLDELKAILTRQGLLGGN